MFGEDTIDSDPATQYFLVASITAGLPGEQAQPQAVLTGLDLVVVAGVILVTLALPVAIVLRRMRKAA